MDGVFMKSEHPTAIGLFDVFCRDGLIQAVNDAHRLGTFPGNDLRGAKEGVGHGIPVAVFFR